MLQSKEQSGRLHKIIPKSITNKRPWIDKAILRKRTKTRDLLFSQTSDYITKPSNQNKVLAKKTNIKTNGTEQKDEI